MLIYAILYIGEKVLRPRSVTKKDEYTISIPLVSKTVNIESGTVVAGIDVKTHCRITGFVARELIKTMTCKFSKDVFSSNCSFLAACHDIGKASPAFQKMIYSVFDDISKYPEIVGANVQAARRKDREFHAAVTQSFLEKEFENLSLYKNIANIEGYHHGFKPAIPKVEDINNPWYKIRKELYEFLKSEFIVGDSDLPDLSNWNVACMVGGFITVADWIASGGEFSSLRLDSIPNEIILKDMAATAVENAGFRRINFIKQLSFENIFGFTPRAAQKTFIDSIKGRGTYILEAPMGLGKTEAALYAAYKMIESGENNGIYFALPTQLTSNRIYERVQLFLSKVMGLPMEEINLKLLHSSAWLESCILGEDGSSGKSWFDDRKRGILAPFAVGTIDQALMAVMNVKHGMVRTFGLAGKVVILDEAHSYDSYTGTLMNELVACLDSIGCTTIILSATLVSSQKREILGHCLDKSVVFKDDYPLISILSHEDNFRQIPVDKGSSKKINLSFCCDIKKACDTACYRAENRELVLFILNTVQDAQSVYRVISARMSGSPVSVGLLHSRFVRSDRDFNETYWVSAYGKGNGNRSCNGMILIGTQVLEQSLDIDADYLITQICPSDMLFQRIGRLWRHRENDSFRPDGADCSCLIIAPDYDKEINAREPFGLSGIVYSKYVLFRTLKHWKNINQIVLPDDIRPVLEGTYENVCEEEQNLYQYKRELENYKQNLRQKALICESTSINTMTDTTVQTRYSEQDNCTVFLMKSFRETCDDIEIEINDVDKVIINKKKYLTEREKRAIAAKIMAHTVSVAEKNAPPYTDKVRIFAPFVYIGIDSEEYPFRMAVLEDDQLLYDINKIKIEADGKYFAYDNTIGYQVINKEI